MFIVPKFGFVIINSFVPTSEFCLGDIFLVFLKESQWNNIFVIDILSVFKLFWREFLKLYNRWCT